MIFKDQDIFAGILLIIFGLTGCFFAAQLENMVVAGLSAAFYPSLLFLVLIACGSTLVYQGRQRAVKTPLPLFKWHQILPLVIALGAYVFLMEQLGFLLSTVCFLLAAMLIFGEKRKKILLTVPLLTSVLVYYLFSTAFMIILP